MFNNNSMYDEMSVMYGQLDHAGSKAIGGGSWSQNLMAFDMCGYIQSAYIVSLFEANDPEAFNELHPHHKIHHPQTRSCTLQMTALSMS